MESPKQFIKNSHGIVIVKCCASCVSCHPDNRTRICVNGEGAVQPSHVCKKWCMKDVYDNIGKGDGKIKKLSYLNFSLEKIVMSKQAGKVPLADIRAEYEKENGSIYELL